MPTLGPEILFGSTILFRHQLLFSQVLYVAFCCSASLDPDGIEWPCDWQFKVFKMVDHLKVPHKSLKSVLLPRSSAIVRDELKRMAKVATGDVSVAYQTLHQQTMASKGVSWRCLTLPESIEKNPWIQLLPAREKEIVAFVYATTSGTFTSVDVSQRIDRVFVNQKPMLPTITPGNKTWLRDVERFLVGQEGLAIQGFPVGLLSKPDVSCSASDPQRMDLAGNAFPSTCLMAILHGVFCCLPLDKLLPSATHCATAASDSDVESQTAQEWRISMMTV
jgi:hypothetical protein